jgi:hypothetical protein
MACQWFGFGKSSGIMWGIAVGNGLIFNLINLLPLIGVILSPILALVTAKVAIDENKNTKFYVSPIHKSI